ncbi:hypothetical protein CHARACLAT_021005 [Characodon lateralis]|uniref:Uncharacterized protein n=1 Tax=Characodon lateralis TaxID=208331 RepID=A0ABU7F5R9_9TELE|nr:hypothetical protein [Characodon lateralis]
MVVWFACRGQTLTSKLTSLGTGVTPPPSLSWQHKTDIKLLQLAGDPAAKIWLFNAWICQRLRAEGGGVASRGTGPVCSAHDWCWDLFMIECLFTSAWGDLFLFCFRNQFPILGLPSPCWVVVKEGWSRSGVHIE